MKLNQRDFLWSCAILLLLASCTKNQENSSKAADISLAVNPVKNKLFAMMKRVGDKISTGVYPVGFSKSVINPNNKFSYLGTDHNAILSRFMGQLSSRSSGRMSSDEKHSLFEIAYETAIKRRSNGTKGGTNSRYDEDMSEQEFDGYADNSTSFVSNCYYNVSSDDQVLTNSENQVNTFVGQSILSYNAGSYVNQYLDELYNCNSLDDMLVLTNYYSDNTTNNSYLSASDQDLLLCYFAISGSSLSYWSSMAGTDQNTAKFKSVQTGARMKWWKWIIVGIADGLGGIASSNPFWAGAIGGVASGVTQDLLSS